jgi:N12 class adenine-specific DNA methylase
MLAGLQIDDRRPTPDEQALLARWAGWGATPAVFDPARAEYEQARAELRDLVGEEGYQAAARTTLNAHYTDAGLVRAIWDAIERQGLADTTGRVLEPGCGAGVFLGMAPDSARELVGVELDPTTAAIAAALYPHAAVRAESFADTRLPANHFDLVIGNVPFADVVLHDRLHNAGRHSLHNHFILKSLALTRPGGVVAVITSHWTMDATNPAARREMAELADLVTAVRLPSSAHQRAAGTSVVSDLLVLRRRAPGEAAADATGWETTAAIGDAADEKAVPVNRYFLDHPEEVIGELGTRLGRFGPELEVSYAGEVDVALRDRLQEALPAAGAENLLFGRVEADLAAPAVARPDASPGLMEGHLAGDPAAGFTMVADGQLRPHLVPASQAKELAALLGLRDTTLALLNAEAATAEDTDLIGELRAQLGVRYDAYAARYGPINRVSTRRTGRTDPDTGRERLARIRPPQGGFRTDPHSPAVYALEHYDAGTGQADKASIFTERVVAPRPARLGADTAEDAVAICLDTHGRVELGEVARLLGTTEADARAALGRLVFDDPTNPDRFIPAVEYLSGNVRVKLTEAMAAAAGDDRFAANVAALVQAQPADLTPAEISVRLGAAWLPASVVQLFLTELLDDRSVQVENPGGSTWAVRGNHYSVLASTTYGTERASAISLAQALLEQRPIRVFDELEDGKRIPNLTETIAAQEKAGELNERFADWIWEDPDRAATLSRRYNDTFNAIVLRSYDGAQRQFPGLSITITPREHQVAAVVRMLSEPTVLLGHEVGAGKTLEMIIGCMELRRLGMRQKPAVVVPNHMLEQFSREWMQAYPQARILAAGTDDLTRDRRRLFVARIATGNWDAVILSRSAFERLPLSPELHQAYLNSQLDSLRDQLQASSGGSGLTVKRLQGQLLRAEERIKKLTDTDRDPAITFEHTGIDYLCVDEAHGYKNLQLASNIPGVAIEGSQRASDLDMKMHFLRSRHGERVACFATATPIANSVAEAYVMQRYLSPEVLHAAGLTDFDTWAATFGEVTTQLELSPDGSRYRMHSRFAKFRNVPELLRMWHLTADIKTAEDLNLPTPAIAGGRAQTIVVPASEQLAIFMRSLAERADDVQARRVDPTVDNMLRVASHGRMAALDLRLLPPAILQGLLSEAAAADTGKLAVAAELIAERYHRNADRIYPGHARPGALQLVFCDLGTPSGEGWNAYAELRDLLVDRGVPAGSVRFIHEARNDREKGELFEAARSGQIAVLIGSTEKMGVGTNVQRRAIAEYHLDCPWRPADLSQRDGRILRQGNLNPEVELFRLVTEASFDAYLWQTVERKARFIAQVMRGRLDVREIEDIGDTALSYAEVKALASGDPRILEKATVDAEKVRLDRLHRAWSRTQRTLESTISSAGTREAILATQITQLEHAAAARVETRGEAFAMTIGGRTYTSRADAATALARELAAITPTYRDVDARVVAQLGGQDVTAAGRRFPDPHLVLELAGTPRSGLTLNLDEATQPRPTGLITRLENRVAGISTTLAELQHDLRRLHTERDRAAAELGQPFPHADALATVTARATELEHELTDQARRDSAATAADHRWRETITALPDGQRITQDPHWPDLVDALTQLHQAGYDPQANLARLASTPLDSDHPAADLHDRMLRDYQLSSPVDPFGAGLALVESQGLDQVAGAASLGL